MNLSHRALKTIRHHRKSSVLLFIYYLLSLCSVLLLGYFTFYLFLSRELITNTIIAIREYEPAFYAEPFEQLRETVQLLLHDSQHSFVFSALIGALLTIVLQCALFYRRSAEYRTYLLLNEKKSTLSHQITFEQLILLNVALVVLFILFFFLHSFLDRLFTQLETSMILQHRPVWEEITIRPLSGVSSILEQSGFTRFHIKPFLIGTAHKGVFKSVLWKYIPFVFITVNSVVYGLIYLTNFLLLHSKRIARSF